MKVRPEYEGFDGAPAEAAPENRREKRMEGPVCQGKRSCMRL
jgi:hypothetical protein